MARFYGKVGYAESVLIRPGVYEDTITEREYYGEVLKVATRYQNANQVLDNLVFRENISICADGYAEQHYSQIKYVEYLGVCWTVNHVEAQRPRLILALGGVYNGPRPSSGTSGNS